MAVTTNFSFQFLNSLLVNPGGGGGENQPDAIGLADGGFAVSHTHSSAHTDIGMYDVNGALTGSALVTNSGNSTNSAITQLTDGNLVVVSEDADSVNVSIRSTSGAIVAEFDIGDTPSTNADVAALTGGGFVVVSQDAFTFPDFDIDINAYNNDGSFAFSFTVDGSGAQDTNPVVAGLDDGGFAVAWVRTVGGETEIWTAVYNGDGTVRTAAAQHDPFGTINTGLDIVAIDGGFALVYEDNGWFGSDTEITLSRFDSSGFHLGFTQVTDNTVGDSNANVTRLSNGYLVVANSRPFTLTDYDIDLRLYDPSGTTLLATYTVEGSSNDADSPSLAAIGEGAIAALWSNFTNGTVEGSTLQGVRTTDSDAAGDFAFGDDFVDIMNGNGGNDTLVGGNNNDILDGGADNDVLQGDAGSDTIAGGSGSDTIFLFNGDGIDFVDGGLDVDLLNLSGITSGSANINMATGVWDLGGGFGPTSGIFNIENVFGTQNNDFVLGSTAGNSLAGSGGNDTINGGAGNDTLSGGTGNDTLVGSTGNDTQNGGGGNDNVAGGFGNDTIDGAAGTDTMNGNEGNDRVFGGTGNDTVNGNAGNDTMDGGDGNDAMNGGTEFDVITGGLGADILTGAGSADTFVYNSITESTVAVAGRDRITDFNEVNTDIIDLSAIDAIAGGANNAFTFIGGAAFTGLGQVRVYVSGADTFVDINTTGTNAADMRIVLTGINTLNIADFIL